MKRKNTKDEIKNYFFINPTSKLRVRQIERELKLSLPSIIKSCHELEKEEIIKKEKIAGAVLYSSDRTSKNFLLEKKLHNLKHLYNSGFVEYLRIELSNPLIIVFGSYAKGEDIENSDIDTYIQTSSPKKLHVEKFERILKRKIQIFSYKSIRDVPNLHLANNIVNGITLNGFLEIFA